jgi:signal transduction histidine kinase
MKSEEHHEEQLKKENAYLHEQLEKVNKKLKDSDAFKSHFLSNITNEIINPFTSILGISKNISRLEAENIGQIHSMAHLIYNEAFDLDFQLQNIFAAAKIESGEVHMELSSIQPYEDVKQMIETFRFKSEKKSQYIEFLSDQNLPHNFVIDADKFHVIIKNLLLNAIIFGDEKTKITVKMQYQDEHLMVIVNNQGKHIDEEDLQNIFDRFTKLDKNINSYNQGHGLGLSVSKAYLDFLDGHIEVDSHEEKGITFSIKIPSAHNNQESLIRDDDLFIDDSEIF